MCGICGIVDGAGAADSPPLAAAVEAMVAAMRHRGPDHAGRRLDRTVSLGMTRLAIQDLSPASHQPMGSPDGTVWLVYNGELYNHDEERRRLEAEGWTFRSRSDTEVVLALYLRHGDAFLDRLRGMFALAVLDTRPGPGRERLLLARDPLGIKPLLYAAIGNRLLFASELKALVASGLVPLALDLEGLRQLVTYGAVLQPRSLLHAVRMLLPGHRLVVEGRATRIERYWRLDTGRRKDLAALPYDEQQTALRAVLEDSVRAHRISDVPLGAFLSGGVDSAVVVALLQRNSTDRVKTFSIGFEAALAAFDETDIAGQTARHLGTEHRRVVVRGETVRDRLAAIVAALDQPSIDGLNSYLVSEAARPHVTVALSGTGGDDLFMGYPWHTALLDAEAAGRLQGPVLSAYGAASNAFHNTFGPGGAAALLAPALRARLSLPRDPYPADLATGDELAGAGLTERMTALTLRGYTQNQLLRDIDVASMAHSLEVRVPYLDREVVDAALALPAASKIRPPGAGARDPMRSSYAATGIKRILVDLARPLLPPGFDQVPKRGFGLPLAAWLAGPLRPALLDTLAEPRIRRQGVLDPVVVARVRAAVEQGDILRRPREGWRLWLLLVLTQWLDLLPGWAALAAGGRSPQAPG